jgi:hypothetical protein
MNSSKSWSIGTALFAACLFASIPLTANAQTQSEMTPVRFMTLAQAEAAVQGGGNGTGILRADSMTTVEMYQKKYGVLAAAEVFLINVAVWGTDWYILNYDFANISLETIKFNLRHGFEWDWDSFRTNQLVHPYHGNLYFNAARTLGYDYFASFAYAVGGSFMWEMFMENHPPSTNDWINTPIGGAFLGEVLYRWSEQILDDRATGSERVWREIGAGILNPVGAINRLILGRVKHKSVYNPHMRNKIRTLVSFGNANLARTLKMNSAADNVFFGQMDMFYGEWFEETDRRFYKPFDVFNLRASLRLGANPPIYARPDTTEMYISVYAYAVLYGKHIYSSKGEPRHLWGFFQHYDFIHNETVELFGHSISPSLISRFPLSANLNLVTAAHLGVTVLGGADNPYYVYENRNYVYSLGFAPKLDILLEWKNRGGLYIRGSHYHQMNLHEIDADGPEGPISPTYGDDRLSVVNTALHVRLWRGLGIGFDHTWYRRNTTFDDSVNYPDLTYELNSVRSFMTARI